MVLYFNEYEVKVTWYQRDSVGWVECC